MRTTIIQGAFFPVPPVRGGALEKMWHQLGIEFARQGHTVTHISRQCDGLPRENYENGVRHLRVPACDQPRNGLWLKWRDLLFSRRACRLVPPSDIVVTNTFWAPILLRRYPGVYVSVERMPKGQMRLYRSAARLHACSSAVRDAILQEDPRAAPRIRIIPNPLTFVADREVDWARKEPLVLYVGRVHPEKGISLLLEAFSRAKQERALTGWKLKIVGPTATGRGGGGEKWVAELQARFAQTDIEWTGPIYDHARLMALFERARLFVYPSLAEKGETFGIAPLEAMAWGAVPTVSALACFQDFITDGVNGLIFDHRSSDPSGGLTRTLTKAGSMDLQPMAMAAMKVRETHSLQSIAGQFLADFETIVAGRQELNSRAHP